MTETRLVGAWHSTSLAEITHTPASQRFRTFLSPLAIHQAPSSVLLLFLVYTPPHKHMDMFPFRVPQKKAPRVDLISPQGFTDSEAHRAEAQRTTQSSPAISAQSRASSQAAYYTHHSEGHNAVSRCDGTQTPAMESTYSFVAPSEAASARTEGSEEREGSVASGKRFRFPKIKLSLTAGPPKPKPKKQPPTPRSAASFGRGGAGNAIRASSKTSPTSPTTTKRHMSSNSDPSAVVDRASTYTDATDTTIDYASDTGTYTPPHTHPGNRASHWSLEPPLDSGWSDNGGFERHQYPTPLEGSTSTGSRGTRTIATTLPNISPEASQFRREEQKQPPRDPSGSVIHSSCPSSSLAGVLTELEKSPRTSREPLVMLSSSPSSPDQHFLSAVPPPSYDEATDTLGQFHDPRNQLRFDGPYVDPHHATYDAPLRQGTYETLRPLPSTPRRYEGRATPMAMVSAYPDHIRALEGQSPWSHGQQSMKKSGVAISGALEYLTKERPTSSLSTTQRTPQKALYRQDPASSESFHRFEHHHHHHHYQHQHQEAGGQPNPPHVLDTDNDNEIELENDRSYRESFVMYHERSVTPTVDRTREHSRSRPRTAPSTPNHGARSYTPLSSTSSPSVPTLSLPLSLPLPLPLPLLATAIQAESDLLIEGIEESQEIQPQTQTQTQPQTQMETQMETETQAQPKQLSKMERALLRRAVVGMKVDNSQLQRS